MAIFVGEAHSAALGMIYEAGASEIRGTYEGQTTEIHPKSKSVIESALEMDDCPTDTRVNQSKIAEKDIKDKKKFLAKRQLLTSCASRLDKNRGTKQYSDYEQKMARLKQQVMLQNQQIWGNGEHKLSYDGEDLSDLILRDISSGFDDVTEQDNALEYLKDLENFESTSNESEIEQCEKMLKRLEGKTDAKSAERRDEFHHKIETLLEQTQFSKSYKEALSSAQTKLRKSHGQEIEDGYNLIPKAADLVNGSIMIGGRSMSSIDIAALYRDKILCSESMPETVATIAAISESPQGATARAM